MHMYIGFFETMKLKWFVAEFMFAVSGSPMFFATASKAHGLKLKTCLKKTLQANGCHCKD